MSKKHKAPLPGQTVSKSIKEALEMVKKVMAEIHLAHISKGNKK